MLSVMAGAFLLLGYETMDLLTLVLAVPALTAVIMMAFIFFFVIVVDVLISLLMFSIKTWGKNSNRLRMATRWLFINAGDPPALFFIVLLILASTAAIFITEGILPKALRSPSIAADLCMSTIFWLLFNAIGVIVESKE